MRRGEEDLVRFTQELTIEGRRGQGLTQADVETCDTGGYECLWDRWDRTLAQDRRTWEVTI